MLGAQCTPLTSNFSPPTSGLLSSPRRVCRSSRCRDVSAASKLASGSPGGPAGQGGGRGGTPLGGLQAPDPARHQLQACHVGDAVAPGPSLLVWLEAFVGSPLCGPKCATAAQAGLPPHSQEPAMPPPASWGAVPVSTEQAGLGRACGRAAFVPQGGAPSGKSPRSILCPPHAPPCDEVWRITAAKERGHRVPTPPSDPPANLGQGHLGTQ